MKTWRWNAGQGASGTAFAAVFVACAAGTCAAEIAPPGVVGTVHIDAATGARTVTLGSGLQGRSGDRDTVLDFYWPLRDACDSTDGRLTVPLEQGSIGGVPQPTAFIDWADLEEGPVETAAIIIFVAAAAPADTDFDSDGYLDSIGDLNLTVALFNGENGQGGGRTEVLRFVIEAVPSLPLAVLDVNDDGIYDPAVDGWVLFSISIDFRTDLPNSPVSAILGTSDVDGDGGNDFGVGFWFTTASGGATPIPVAIGTRTPTELGAEDALYRAGVDGTGQVDDSVPFAGQFDFGGFNGCDGGVPHASFATWLYREEDSCLCLDYTQDRTIDSADLGAFIQFFVAGDPVADLTCGACPGLKGDVSTRDGVVDSGDLGTFLIRFIPCFGQ